MNTDKADSGTGFTKYGNHNHNNGPGLNDPGKNQYNSLHSVNDNLSYVDDITMRF